jgi:hypothetical protein
MFQKINALNEAGVKRIHLGPISDYEEQNECFYGGMSLISLFPKDCL